MEKIKGRLQKQESEKLSLTVNVRFAEKELAKIDKKASSLGLTRSEYLRSCSLNNLEKNPAFRTIPDSVKSELIKFRKDIDYLKVMQIEFKSQNLNFRDFDSLIISLHRSSAEIEKIIRQET